ncbi:helix-turn-helix domain-containing protein [Emticicia sp. SJ17W-69]|uniref:helix-turn-helix domain-containing protein n=1 Tax=Emticicia sp. SJ17W-69 TaxID=3421657 RepID=UPI003EBA3766
MPFFHNLQPTYALRDYVKMYRFLYFSFTDSTLPPAKAYPPRPEVTLSFYPRDTETTKYDDGRVIAPVRSALIGQPSVVSHRHVGKEFVLFQVVFQPGGLFRMTGIPNHELTDQYFDAESVFGNEIVLVNQRLNSTANFGEMKHIIEGFLLDLASKSKYESRPIDKVGMVMLDGKNNFSLDWLAKESCLSNKQFERNFNERIGINPKYFARIIRFDKAFRLKNAFPNKDWLSIALECGYYDYQHLVRDYKEFTGMTPANFYSQDIKAPERKFGIIEV